MRLPIIITLLLLTSCQGNAPTASAPSSPSGATATNTTQQKIMALITAYDSLATQADWQRLLTSTSAETLVQETIGLYHLNESIPVYQVRLLDGLGYFPFPASEQFLQGVLGLEPATVLERRQAYASLLRLNLSSALALTPSLLKRSNERQRGAYFHELLKRDDFEARQLLQKQLLLESSPKIRRQIKSGLIRKFKTTY